MAGPAVERFSQYPKIDVRVDGTDNLANLADGEADIAIRYGGGDYRGHSVDKLFNQVNTPVCSPRLLEGPNPLNNPDDLRHHTLLHTEWKSAEATWSGWLQAVGLNGLPVKDGPTFTQESMALQAACDVQGVALIGDRLVADHLSSGQLIRPFGPNFSPPLAAAYYLVTPSRAGNPSHVAAFKEWILETAKRPAVIP